MARARATMDPPLIGTPSQGEGARTERRSVGRDSDATSETARFASTTPVHETNRRDAEEKARRGVGPMHRGDEKPEKPEKPEPRKEFGEKTNLQYARSVFVDERDFVTANVQTGDATTEHTACHHLERNDELTTDDEGSQKHDKSWNERERERVSSLEFPHANRALPESAVSQIKAAYKRGLAAPVAPPPRRLGRPVDVKASDSTTSIENTTNSAFDDDWYSRSRVTNASVGFVGDDETSSRFVEKKKAARRGRGRGRGRGRFLFTRAAVPKRPRRSPRAGREMMFPRSTRSGTRW